VVATILIGDEVQRGREELRLLEGLHVWEVEVTAQTSKALRRRVVRACRQL
jgi:hypothetical protein